MLCRQWFGRMDRDGFVYRSWVKGKGVPDDEFDGRPVIGICNTWSQATPCNAHFRELAQHVRECLAFVGGHLEGVLDVVADDLLAGGVRRPAWAQSAAASA